MRKKANQEIRRLIILSGFAQWEIASFLNLGESSFCRLLRKELTPKQKEELVRKIQEAIKAGEHNGI